MDFNKMSRDEIVKYASLSPDNILQVKQWIRSELKRQKKMDRIVLIIGLIGFLLSIIALAWKLWII